MTLWSFEQGGYDTAKIQDGWNLPKYVHSSTVLTCKHLFRWVSPVSSLSILAVLMKNFAHVTQHITRNCGKLLALRLKLYYLSWWTNVNGTFLYNMQGMKMNIFYACTQIHERCLILLTYSLITFQVGKKHKKCSNTIHYT